MVLFKKQEFAVLFFFDWRVQTIITWILDQLRPSCLQRSRFSCTVDLRCRLGYVVIVGVFQSVSFLILSLDVQNCGKT